MPEHKITEPPGPPGSEKLVKPLLGTLMVWVLPATGVRLFWANRPPDRNKNNATNREPTFGVEVRIIILGLGLQ